MALLLHLALATAMWLPTSASTVVDSSSAIMVAVVEGGHASTSSGSTLLQQAAREVRRYHFAATGELLPLKQVPCQGLEEAAARSVVLLVSAGCATAAAAAAVDGSSPLQQQLRTVAALRGEQHILLKQQGPLALPTAVLLGGGSPRGVLHGAYFYAEHGLGVHFAIGGDSVPQQQSAADLAQRLRRAPTAVVQSPVFDTRGLNPFHDFAEGPDFWTEQDYKAYTTQMSKLRMNFIGFHSYNYYNEVHANAIVTLPVHTRHSAKPPPGPSLSRAGRAEPLIWQGPLTAVDGSGNVSVSYLDGQQPVSWTSTCISQDGLQQINGAAMYMNGASSFFPEDCYPKQWQRITEQTMTEAAAIDNYNYAASMLGRAFRHARKRGVRVGVGNEVPAMPPRQLPTTLAYLNAFEAPADHFLTSGFYACEYSTFCTWMCGALNGGKRKACASDFQYVYKYGHHNVQSWLHTAQVPYSIELVTWYNGSATTPGNTLLGTSGAVPTGYEGHNYSRVRHEGWIFPPNATQAMLPAGANLADMQPLRLWRQPSTTNRSSCTGAADNRTGVCVADAKWVHGKRAMPYTAWINDPTTTQDRCAMACHTAGFAFAGVEAGSACFCGHALPMSKRLPWASCEAVRCVGNTSEPCGAGNVLLAFPVVCHVALVPTSFEGDVFATSSALLEQQAAASGFTVPVATLGLVYSKRPFRWLQDMYQASFERVQRAMPSDLFWLWTQEIWNARASADPNVGGINSSAVTSVVEDFLAADAAAKAMNASFSLGTSGWTLGPMEDRAYFDKILPRDWTLTSIDENLGHAGVEVAYAQVQNRSAEGGKWIIPWAEDDPHLGATQLWVNRTLQHMDAAKDMSVDGALLITWRMEAVGPTIWALSHKSWNASLSAADAWAGWASGEFELNRSAALKVGAAFAALEGAEQSLHTAGCPGFPVQCTDPKILAAYAAKVHAIAGLVHFVPAGSAGAQARWRRWLSFLRYVVASTEAGCLAVGYPAAAAKVRALSTAAARKVAAEQTLVPLRQKMVSAAHNLTTLLVAAVAGPGEMGMLSTMHDIELLNQGRSDTDLSYGENLLNASATAELAEWLNGSLPVGTTPTQAYTGPPRLVARAVRSSVDKAESVPVSVVVLAPELPSSVDLMHRQMGVGEWQATVMQRTGGVGSVYDAQFVVNQHGDGEYFILAHIDDVELRWPECHQVEAARQTCATQTVTVVADYDRDL